MFMKSFFIFSGIVLFFTGIMAQEPGRRSGGAQGDIPKGKITGTVLDNTTGQPVEYANVAVYRLRDSTLVTGTISDPAGAFVLDDLMPGRYYVTINFIGYNKTRKQVQITPNSRINDLGEIKLEQAVTDIEGVEIVADKARIEYKIDRKVVNVSQDLVAAGGSAVDVMENTPSVKVDIEGNVTLRGSGQFTVLIDGKPTVLEGSDALQQIPASTIENIEIITNPSAKYDPDGMAGIINVVLKKNKGGGLSGIVNATVGTGNKYSGDFLLNYKTNKFNTFIGADYNDQQFTGSLEGTRKTFRNDTVTMLENNMVRNYNRSGYVFKGGFDYYITELITLTLSGDVGTYKRGSNNSGLLREFTQPATREFYTKSKDNSVRSGDYYNLNMNYQHKFNQEGHELNALVYYSSEGGSDSENELEELSDNEGNITGDIPLTDLRTTETENSYELRVKTDYILPVKKGKFEAGYQTRIDADDETFLFEERDPETGEWINNELYSSAMEFFRGIHSG